MACDHLTTLSLRVARGELGGYTNFDPLLDILAERGRAHETAYLTHLTARGLSVESAQALASPLELMVAGVDVITQARLAGGMWGGRTDFLVRVPRPTPAWAWSYEVIDTKLSADTRAGAVLQLCVYSDLLGELQGLSPDWMHVVHPGAAFPRDSYRVDEYAPIYRALRRDLEARTTATVTTYPEPTSHCEICHWRSRCDGERRADDHLSLVADLGRLHRRELKRVGINTISALASVPEPWPHKPDRGSMQTYARLAHQARLQVAARGLTVPPYELLPLEPERGLARLPAPSTGDVFLDLEGDPFIDAAGREYLFGWVTAERGYEARWAIDAAAERAAYEDLVDTLMARWATDPSMHVYHYAPYEPTALKRLMGRYGSRADELDRLLRGRRFVDLYAVTRQALRAGIESYSIKFLEPIIGYVRAIGLDAAGTSHRALRLALQRGIPDAIQPRWRVDVEAYNRDDCVAAAALRDWLEARRAEVVDGGGIVVRPTSEDGQPTDDQHATRSERQVLASRLLETLPDPAGPQTDEQHARWLLAHLLEWYQRELKPEYWDYFRLAETSDEARLDEPKAIAGLEWVGVAGRTRKGIPIDRFRFPPQEVLLDPETDLFATADGKIDKLGEVVAVDTDVWTIDIKKSKRTADDHPTSVIARTIIQPGEKERALLTLGTAVAGGGFPDAQTPSPERDLLERRPPRNLPLHDGSLRAPAEDALACARRIALAMDGAVLPIQGPPGAGKTFIATEMILELLRAGRRVAVAATSHKVVRNLVARVAREATARNIRLRGALRTDGEPGEPILRVEETTDNARIDARIRDLNLVGSTAWLFARARLARVFDVLFIDEAGQMSIADALACAQAARSLVLVGDPQQLQQPVRGTHPDGVARSALQHLLGDAETIAPGRGLFLEETWRMHPTLCAFTSEQFYERRLGSAPGLDRQSISTPVLNGPGLYRLAVVHDGNQNRSTEEAEAIADVVARCLVPGSTWTDAAGSEHALTVDDFRIVAPYNAHVAVIRDALKRAGLAAPVGTVDKFQGQEAPIAIYAMGTSLPQDAPRGLAFLYDRHRLNVATSRARCASILVHSPGLLRPDCQTPAHLHLASALCRFVELARILEPLRTSSANS